MEKLKQLNDLIEEKKQDREERWRQMERNKIADEKDNQWMKKLNENVKAHENKIIAKKKQLDVLFQR